MSTRERRRYFTAEYKLQILERVDRCESAGEIGEILAEEGLYHSHIAAWRRLRREGALDALRPKKPGPKTQPRGASSSVELQAEISRLRRRLRKAETLLDLQRKCFALLQGRSGGASTDSG